MNSLWEALGVSLTTSVAILFVLGTTGYLLRTWVAERVSQSIKHSFNRSLEQYKNQLSQTATEYSSIRSAANAALLEGQRVSAEWRIKSADEMWREILRLRDVTGAALTMLDLLNPDEYHRFVTDSSFRSVVPKLGDLQIMGSLAIEHVRPFIGEQSFALMFVYRGLVGRIYFLLARDVAAGHVTRWFEDDSILQLLREVLTTEEMRQFNALTKHRILWAQTILERKIVGDLRNVIAGTQAVDEGLEQARKIVEAVRIVESQATGSGLA